MSAGPKKSGRLFFPARPTAVTATDPGGEQVLEQRLLLVSLATGLFFAALGLIWGAAIKSQMLIFDGAYSFVSMVMTGLSVYVSKAIFAGEDERFHFGRSQLEPLIVIMKSISIIAVCALALIIAVDSLMYGGREINSLSAMVYSLIGIPGCICPWIYIARERKKMRLSGLTKAEGRQLLFDTLLSVAMVAGFLLAHLSRGTEYSDWAIYADSAMVVVAVFFFSTVPVVSLIGGIRDMLRMAPGGNVYRASRLVLGEIAKERGFDGFVLRIGKVGRRYYYQIGFVSGRPDDTRSIGELDTISAEVEERLMELFNNPITVRVSFMHDARWG